MANCPFCKRIKAGEYFSYTADPDVVWFEPLNPVTPGHLLFVPVRHVEDALTDPYEAAITMEIASRRWCEAWPGRAEARDCNFITSAGRLASQTVMHLHVHVVPRRLGDGLALPWPQDPKCGYCYCRLSEHPECAAYCAHAARGHRGCAPLGYTEEQADIINATGA